MALPSLAQDRGAILGKVVAEAREACVTAVLDYIEQDVAPVRKRENASGGTRSTIEPRNEQLVPCGIADVNVELARAALAGFDSGNAKAYGVQILGEAHACVNKAIEVAYIVGLPTWSKLQDMSVKSVMSPSERPEWDRPCSSMDVRLEAFSRSIEKDYGRDLPESALAAIRFAPYGRDPFIAFEPRSAMTNFLHTIEEADLECRRWSGGGKETSVACARQFERVTKLSFMIYSARAYRPDRASQLDEVLKLGKDCLALRLDAAHFAESGDQNRKFDWAATNRNLQSTCESANRAVENAQKYL
jgi:hypothetical protein